MLNQLEAEALFSRYGITLEGAKCSTLAEAEKEIAKGGTYFLKLVSSSEEATHKTEYGYVAKVTSADTLKAAWSRMVETAEKNGHKDISFILQEGRSGHEVMIGAKRDPIFGFQVIFTPEGGKYAEIAAKAVPPSVRVGRLTKEEALSMITEHPMSAKIMGARGEAPCDIDSLVELLVNISRLMDENLDVQAIDLNPVFASPEGIYTVDARVETRTPEPMPQEFYTNRDLSVFKHPKRVFVVLASAKPNSLGWLLLNNVIKTVGDVKVMLPTGKGLDTLKEITPNIVEDVPDDCDLLVYAGIPVDAPDIVAKFREKGGRGMVIISSDFAETGNKELERRLRESAGDMPYVGPNGLGVYCGGLNTFFIDEKRTAYPEVGGSVALFSQSGGLCLETYCENMNARGIPVNEVFSLGNGSGISFTEILNSIAVNNTVDCVVLHLEGGLKEGEGPFFIEALKKTTAVKPVIVLPAGFSNRGRKIAASHTGRMTSGADALIAALKQGGAFIAKSEEELRLVLWMINVMPRATGKAVVFTTGGGKGVLAVDAAERIGLELLEKLPPEFTDKVKDSMPAFADCSQNPLDFTGSVNLDGMLSILEHSKLVGSPGVIHVFMSVPGGTLRFIDGKATRIADIDAIELIAKTIKENRLPLVLNICAQSKQGRDLEHRAEEQGIVVTRTDSTEMVLSALKLVTEVWRKYPNLDIATKTL